MRNSNTYGVIPAGTHHYLFPLIVLHQQEEPVGDFEVLPVFVIALDASLQVVGESNGFKSVGIRRPKCMNDLTSYCNSDSHL